LFGELKNGGSLSISVAGDKLLLVAKPKVTKTRWPVVEVVEIPDVLIEGNAV
jgi:hypothetical protein